LLYFALTGVACVALSLQPRLHWKLINATNTCVGTCFRFSPDTGTNGIAPFHAMQQFVLLSLEATEFNTFDNLRNFWGCPFLVTSEHWAFTNWAVLRRVCVHRFIYYY
jgi:hypothetical protein